MVDIRGELPIATKSGTAAKPVWQIGDAKYKFVQPVKASGVTPKGRKVRLGSRTLAKYVAGKTTKGADLLFVGVFAKVAG